MRISRTTLLIFSIFVLALPAASRAQFRSDVQKPDPPLNTADAMTGTSQGGDFFSTLFDPARFSMHQTYSMSMVSSPGVGNYGLSMFTNTFSYKAADNLFVSADVSAVYSPFSSFGSAWQNQMNGIYLTNARLDWKLSDNTLMRIEYLGGPQTYGYNPFYDAYNPFASAPPTQAPPSAPPTKVSH